MNTTVNVPKLAKRLVFVCEIKRHDVRRIQQLKQSIISQNALH